MPTQVRPVWRIVTVVLAFGLGIASAEAGPFNDMVVFGDSLSDVGNIAQASFEIYPGPAYFNDRFSNGPVWVESLSVDLGFGSIQRSTAGGDNFAYGGAQTTGTGGFEGLFIRDVNEQVSLFLNTRSVDPGALFVVFAGSNDLIGGQMDVNVPVGSLAEDIGRLITAGAKQFLVPNLPLLGFTPRYNDAPSLAAQYNLRTEQFNAALNMTLDSLAADNLALTFYRLDVAFLFADAIAEPARFGLTNVVDSAATGLKPGLASYDTSQVAANPNEYLFWDDLHPTTAVHAIVADRALALLARAPADFDASGAVDGADLATWETGFGTSGAPGRSQGDADGDRDVDGADFLLWQRQLGNSSTEAAAVTVPEPASLTMLVAGIVLIVLQRPAKPS